MKKVYFLFLLMVSLTATAQDGWVYPSFAPSLTSYSNPFIIAKDYATDKLYVAYDLPTGTKVSRLDPTTGAIDSTFSTSSLFFIGSITAMHVQTDGKLVVAGTFTSYNGNTSIKRLIRFTTTGGVDTSFTPDWNTLDEGEFICNDIAENGLKIILGGSSSDGNILYQLEKSNGGFDTTFNTNASNITGTNRVINAIDTFSNGDIAIGGYFNTYNGGFSAGTLCRITSTGTLVTGYRLSGFTGTVNAIAVQPDNKIVFAGTNSLSAPKLLRTTTTGALDSSFASVTITGTSVFAGPSVSSLVLQPSGKIIFSGEFTTISGVNRSDVARVTSAGVLDLTFDPGTGPNSTLVGLNRLVLDSSNNVYVSGTFTAFNSYSRLNLVKLSSSVMGRPALEVDTPEIYDNKISIFPNPSNSIFNLQVEGYDGEAFELEVYNALGQLVLKSNLSGQSVYQIDLSSVETGNYFVRMQNSNTVINKIIAVKR